MARSPTQEKRFFSAGAPGLETEAGRNRPRRRNASISSETDLEGARSAIESAESAELQQGQPAPLPRPAGVFYLRRQGSIAPLLASPLGSKTPRRSCWTTVYTLRSALALSSVCLQSSCRTVLGRRGAERFWDRPVDATARCHRFWPPTGRGESTGWQKSSHGVPGLSKARAS